MKAKASAVLSHAVDIGIKTGIRRFYKHRNDAPEQVTLNAMVDTVSTAVLDEIDTWFDMEEGD